jgi:hypothetical protein
VANVSCNTIDAMLRSKLVPNRLRYCPPESGPLAGDATTTVGIVHGTRDGTEPLNASHRHCDAAVLPAPTVNVFAGQLLQATLPTVDL